jgi:hypothetical protein
MRRIIFFILTNHLHVLFRIFRRVYLRFISLAYVAGYLAFIVVPHHDSSRYVAVQEVPRRWSSETLAKLRRHQRGQVAQLHDD